MLAVGLAAAAIAASVGASMAIQLVAAAFVGAVAVAAWHLKRGTRPDTPPAEANRDVNLDVGETVQIQTWNPDGTATIKYRGANWTAVALDGVVHGTGAHRVREVVGNRLVVEKI
jgi:membrane protein implicated in regulation of membrane protease activity